MVVLDTSVIYKWFAATEEKRDEAKEFLIRHLNNTDPILIPDLLLYEITNAWTTKTTLTKKEIDHNISLIQTYSLLITPSTFQLMKNASQLAKTYAISIYDAVYIALAEENKCRVITADEKLIKKVSLSFVENL